MLIDSVDSRGLAWDDDDDRCPECGGRGEVMLHEDNCDGSYVIDGMCDGCDGEYVDCPSC